jgi:type II secretory pathway component GspD/PulD (secretin)
MISHAKIRTLVFLCFGLFLGQAYSQQTPEQLRRQVLRDSIRAVRAAASAAPATPVRATLPTSLGISEAQSKPADLPIPDSIMIPALNIKETNIRDLLQGFAVQYGLNLFLAPEVTGTISVNFTNIKLKDAFLTILTQNGYRFEVEHGTISVQRQQAKIQMEALPPPPPSKPFLVEWEPPNLSLDIVDAPLEDVVRAIVTKTGKNIVVDQGPSVRITVLAKSLETGKALAVLAKSNGFLLRERDGIFTLSRPQLQSQAVRESTDQLTIHVNNADTTVSIDASGAQLLEVVTSIFAQAGINAVIYGKLTGTVTAKLESLPIGEALRHLFRGTAYTAWDRNGVFCVGGSEMRTAENSSLIRLKHMRAEDVVKLLPESLAKGTQIQLIKAQNGIMATGTWETVDAIRSYIEKMDLPVPQILIEALVIDVDVDKATNFGIDLFIGDASKVTSTGALFPSIDQVLNRTQSQSLLGKLGLGDVLNLPRGFGARIQALQQDKILKVKARSQIATLNGETAVLTIGQTQFFLLKSETDFNQGAAVTNKVTERFEKVEANATLTVTPYVTGTDEVTCEIIPDFSEPEGAFNSSVPPTLNKRYVKSSVRLRAGETIVLGGMVKEGTQQVSSKVPFLGDLPLLGWLFRSTQNVEFRSQLMIFVTPKIYYGSEGAVDVKQALKALED